MTHYEILGIRKTASSDEIKTAYKKLVKKYHPDVYVGDKTFAEKKIKEINEAYDVLSNPDLKKEYDDKINPQYTSYSPNNYSSYTYSSPNYNTSTYSYKTTSSKRNAQARDSKYSYENYKRTYNSTNYGSYDYQKRYTDYHRSKTPNSNYSANNTNNKYSEKIVDTFFNSTNISKSVTLFFIIICFIIFFIVNVAQITSLFGDISSSISSASNSNDDSSYNNYNYNVDEDNDYYDSATNNNNLQNSNPYLESEESTTNSDMEDFDINDYFSDDEIMDAYLSYGSAAYNSFEEFKQALTEAFYQAYILHY